MLVPILLLKGVLELIPVLVVPSPPNEALARKIDVLKVPPREGNEVSGVREVRDCGSERPCSPLMLQLDRELKPFEKGGRCRPQPVAVP